ncbi:MAG: hypothetical protein KAR44_07990 [Candidatus Aegiribacteria sp.]|nr:hypothetical protein [Candidatus Aegiribacteria sp.]
MLYKLHQFPFGITIAVLLLTGFGIFPGLEGTLSAEDTDFAPQYLRDVPVPLPHEVGPDVYLPEHDLPTEPPVNPQVGDSWIWWLWVFDPMPPHFEQHVCTVRGKSDRGYVVVRDLEWGISIFQSDVDAILERWENSSIGPYPTQGIYEIDSIAFGEPPDELDDDIRIYLMWFEFGIAADGFFFWFDEYPDGAFPPYHSNECEVLYLNPTSSGGPSGDYMLAVAAHEFEHMIHWKYDDNEESWVDEGLAELAMWFYGNPDNISGFNSAPDNDLTIWDGNWSDYIQTYLWTLYFFEQYGGHPSIYAAVHEAGNSIAGYEQVLDDFGYTEDVADVFADWTVANFLDDISLEDGRYGYIGDDLPPFNVMGTYSTYPVSNVSRTVKHWATDYYRFQTFSGFQNLQLSFDGNDTNNFAVWGLALYDNDTTEVLRMVLNETTQAGTLEITGLADPDDQVILVVASVSSTGSMDYIFSAGDSQGIELETPAAQTLSIQATPNPFTSAVTLQLNWSGISGAPAVDIFDINGRLVRRLSAEENSESSAMVTWNGCLEDGNPAAPGIYFARGLAGSASSVTNLLLLP